MGRKLLSAFDMFANGYGGCAYNYITENLINNFNLKGMAHVLS